MPRSLNGGIKVSFLAITLAEWSSLVVGLHWEIFPVVERKRVNTGRFCTVRSACCNSLNMDHPFKSVPFCIVKVCASSKQRVIIGSLCFGLDFLVVCEGMLHIEATKVASAS